MAAASDDLGRVARGRGIKGHDSMFTCGSIVRNMPQNGCVPGCKKKVYKEDGVKISFHKFPEGQRTAQEMDSCHTKRCCQRV